MNEQKYKEVKDYVPTIDAYEKEVHLVEQFLEENQLSVDETTPVFWNHIIALLERINQNEQNTLEIEGMEERTPEAIHLTDDFVEYMNQSINFGVTDFEKYLLVIYFEQLDNQKEEKGKNHE